MVVDGLLYWQNPPPAVLFAVTTQQCLFGCCLRLGCAWSLRAARLSQVNCTQIALTKHASS